MVWGERFYYVQCVYFNEQCWVDLEWGRDFKKGVLTLTVSLLQFHRIIPSFSSPTNHSGV